MVVPGGGGGGGSAAAGCSGAGQRAARSQRRGLRRVLGRGPPAAAGSLSLPQRHVPLPAAASAPAGSQRGAPLLRKGMKGGRSSWNDIYI